MGFRDFARDPDATEIVCCRPPRASFLLTTIAVAAIAFAFAVTFVVDPAERATRAGVVVISLIIRRRFRGVL